MTKPYWCFICEKQFTASFKEIGQCPVCHQQAFQEITENEHPEQYEVYRRQTQQPPQQQYQPQQNPNFQIRITSANLTPNDYNFIFSGILNNLPTIMSESMRVLNNLMRNLEESGERYRRASQEEIEALQKIQKPKQCSICQAEDLQDHNEGYRLRCGHEFHIVCIKPWFEKANTCPTCRTALTPTAN